MFQRKFPPETFAVRRWRVAERIGERAVAVVQGARGPGSHDQFRQSNELFYLCGVEVPHAYLLIDGRDGTAALFLPHQDRHSVEAEGQHLSADNAQRARELTGVDRTPALEALPVALRGVKAIWTPLSPAEGARSVGTRCAGHRRRRMPTRSMAARRGKRRLPACCGSAARRRASKTCRQRCTRCA